MFLAV